MDDDWPPRFPNRGWETDPRSAAAHERLIILHLAALKELEEKSRPILGAESASRKDGDAFEALGRAVDLFDVVAGWAANHTVGLGVAGLAFVPRGPQQTRGEEYQAARAKVDKHEHEERGGYHEYNEASPEEARRAARNLLRSLSNSRSMGAILRPLCDALEALEYGETLDIIKPAGVGKKRQYRESNLQLKTIGFVAYREKVGGLKKDARDEVAAAYCVAADTIRSWEDRARKDPKVGRLYVEQQIGMAHNAASWIVAARRGTEVRPDLIERMEGQYGLDALKRAGAEYQAALREES
jgi:hypothetical protein